MNKFKRLKIVVAILQFFSPGYGTCRKCGLPWNWCTEKSVAYSDSSATFATCDHCWDNSTLPELKQYYAEVYDDQQRGFLPKLMDHSKGHLLACVTNEYVKDLWKIEYDRDEDGNLISCCGDVLDEDVMICPTCGEHC